jgi:hypothetical protein
MGIVGAVTSIVSLGLSAYSASDSRKKGKAVEKDKKREIGRQKQLEEEENRRAKKKIEDRQLAIELEGSPATFKSGMLGLTGDAPVKKKRLG